MRNLDFLPLLAFLRFLSLMPLTALQLCRGEPMETILYPCEIDPGPGDWAKTWRCLLVTNDRRKSKKIQKQSIHNRNITKLCRTFFIHLNNSDTPEQLLTFTDILQTITQAFTDQMSVSAVRNSFSSVAAGGYDTCEFHVRIEPGDTYREIYLYLTIIYRKSKPLSESRDPFQYLPMEICENIFEKYVEDDSEVPPTECTEIAPGWTHGSRPLLLSAVCKSWRQTATSYPALWRNIHLSTKASALQGGLKRAELYLQNSKQWGNDLFIQVVDPLDKNSLDEIQAIMSNEPNINNITCQYSSPASAWSAEVLLHALPFYPRTLTLSNIRSVEREESQLCVLFERTTIPLAFMNQLTTLNIRNVGWGIHGRDSFLNLQHLSVVYEDTPEMTSQLFALLNRMPNLRCLTLECNRPFEATATNELTVEIQTNRTSVSQVAQYYDLSNFRKLTIRSNNEEA